ncbi:hypothetical protein C8R43DRAFT_1003247 [Mycena crocata]|nr:hypothetical protein C8R43DRAFT_1003247 [Mycena crocata]
MTDLSSDLSAAEIQFELNVNYYFSIAAFTLLFYDYLLTLNLEIVAFWGSRITWATTLFYINRYMSLFGSIPVVMEYFWTTLDPRKLETCHSLQTYHQYFAIVAQACVAAMLIMRTHALYGRSRKLLAFMLVVTFAAAAIGAYIIVTDKGDSTGLNNMLLEVGCATGLVLSSSRRIGFGWTGMLVFDIMIFVLTAWKALVVSREQRGGLIKLLMRDGSAYFLIMVVSNCGNIMSFMYAGPYIRGVGTTFTNVISSIAISRLMLNLRYHNTDNGPLRTAQSTTLYDAPITTVVDPYYPSTAYGTSRGMFSTSGSSGSHLYEDEISLQNLHTRANQP